MPTTNDTVITAATGERRPEPGVRVTFDARLVHLRGNDRPYFSLTGVRYERGRVACAGQMHDELVALWPELAPLAAIHLADDNGVPMYAVENGAYFLGFTSGTIQATNLATFARLWRISEHDAVSLRRQIMQDADDQPQRRHLLSVEAERMSAKWATEAEEAIALIDRLAAGAA